MKAGGTPSRENPRYWGGAIRFVLIEDITQSDKYLRTTREAITQEGLDNSSSWCLQSGNLIYTLYGTVGRSVINEIPVAITQNMAGIIPDNRIVDTDFLYYSLIYSHKHLWTLIDISVHSHVSITKAKQIPIPLPPLPEQKRIAAVLSAVQEAREKTEAVIRATREMKKSLMKHLFTYGPVSLEEAPKVPLKDTEIGPVPEGWKVVKLGAVCQKTNQTDPTRNPAMEFQYIDVSSVSNECLRIIGHTRYKGTDAPSRARKLIRQNDIIFATVRPYLRRVAMVPPQLDGQICSTAFCVIRGNPAIADAQYLFFTISMDRFVREISEHQRGSSYPAVSDKNVLTELIPLPPLPAQRTIAEILTPLNNKVEAEESKKRALDDLFKTLLANLMTGKIRVNQLEAEA